MMSRARETFFFAVFSPSPKTKQTLTFDFALKYVCEWIRRFFFVACLLVSLGRSADEKKERETTREFLVGNMCTDFYLLLLILSRMDMKNQVRVFAEKVSLLSLISFFTSSANNSSTLFFLSFINFKFTFFFIRHFLFAA